MNSSFPVGFVGNRSFRRMEEVNKHCSVPSNATVTLGPEFTVFITIKSLIVVALIAFVILITKLVIQSPAALPVRVLLTNVLVANVGCAVVVLILSLMSLLVSLPGVKEPPLEMCRFILWLYGVASEGGVLGLVAISVMTVQTVVSTTRTIGRKWLTVTLVVTWIVAVVVKIPILVPHVTGVQYFGGVVCSTTEPHLDNRMLYCSLLSLWMVTTLLSPLLVISCITAATLCYMKCHTISEGVQFKKALARFAAFLITAMVFDILGVVAMVSARFISPGIAGVYVFLSFRLLSLIPTPLLVVVFLKDVQKWLCQLFFSKCLRNSEVTRMQQDDMIIHVIETVM